MIDNFINNKKSFNYIDKETGKYVQCECEFMGTNNDLHDFFGLLRSMKLDSKSIPDQTLKDGKTTSDLINGFKNILNDEVISFENIKNIYNNQLEDKPIFQIPIIEFLSLFDIKKVQEFSQKEFASITRATTNPCFQKTESFKKTKKELQSINLNSKIINRKPDIIKQTRNKNKVYAS